MRSIVGNGCTVGIVAIVGFMLLLHPFVIALIWTLRLLTRVLGG